MQETSTIESIPVSETVDTLPVEDYSAIALALANAKNLLKDENVRHVRGQLFATPEGEWPTEENLHTTNGFCIRGAMLWANGIKHECGAVKGNLPDRATQFLSPIVVDELKADKSQRPSWYMDDWDSVWWNNEVAQDKNDLIKLLDLGIAKAERLAAQA